MIKLFKEMISNPKYFLSANSGKDFENRIETFLKLNIGLVKIKKEDINNFKELKSLILEKDNENILINNKWFNLNNTFIIQPFGSQNYPDFIVFYDNKIYSIETKFTQDNKEKPIWNSGVPRLNGIYIFGSYGKGEITFFKGSDVISKESIILMENFFQDLKSLESNINNQLYKYDIKNTGFSVYIRKAYTQKNLTKETNISFFKNKDRIIRENNVLNLF